MTKQEKIEYLARLWMYGAKVGYNADISQVEYFIRLVGDDLGLDMEGLITSAHITDAGELGAPEDEVIEKFRAALIAMNA
jgi:hypothetical protein